jgi:AmiR/NasT family two-component response regulator
MKKLKILIAEAESQIRTELDRMLSSLGHESVPAADGREALELFAVTDPDLAVLDAGMPFPGGLDAARAMCRHRAIPILILTPADEKESVGVAARLPIQGFLVKPVGRPALADAIEKAVARFEEAQAEEREAAELRFDLESRRIVSRAKSRLMRQGKTEEEAYTEIRRQARSQHISLRLSAAEMLRILPE